MSLYLLVSGDFARHGGMDRPNYELAWHLAERLGADVHLVAHRVEAPLADHPRISWHRVPRPFARAALGEPLLAWAGRRVARALGPGARVVVNGGNCPWPDANWVHALHSPFSSRGEEGWALPISAWLRRRRRRMELRALKQARVVIANSERTRREVIALAGLAPSSVKTVPYGIDPTPFAPVGDAERLEARRRLGLNSGRMAAAFVGALGRDRRKGFDVAFAAWRALCADGAWDVDLLAAGAGPELGYWRGKAREAGLADRVRLLGFSHDIATVLAASDVLVSPVFYEAYGSAVHEAVACGLPPIVTASAGVAESLSPVLAPLLLPDPPTAALLAERLRLWRREAPAWKERVLPDSARLRRRTWETMSREIVAAINEVGPS